MISEKEWQDVLDHTEANIFQDEFPGVAAKIFCVMNNPGYYLWLQLESGDVQLKQLDQALTKVASKFGIDRREMELRFNDLLCELKRDVKHNECYEFDGVVELFINYRPTLREKCDFVSGHILDSILFERSDYELLEEADKIFNSLKSITEEDVMLWILESATECTSTHVHSYDCTITMEGLAEEFSQIENLEDIPVPVTIGEQMQRMEAFKDEDAK